MDQDYDLAVRHQLEGRFGEAETLCRAIVARDPTHARAYHLLGVIEYRQGRFDEAIAFLRESLALVPDNALALNHLGAALLAHGEMHEAIAAYRQAILHEPNDAALHNHLGNALRRAGEGDAALASYRRALELAPLAADARNNLATVQRDQGLIGEAVAGFEAAARLAPDLQAAREIGSNLLFTIQFHPGYGSAAIHAKHREWEARHAEPLARRVRAHQNDRSVERRLRVGYVSPNWCDHAQALFTVPLLSSHDRELFEIYVYSDVRRPDAVTKRLEGYVDAWRSVAGETDARLADRVRDDHIDILVDLTMHMANGRLLTFAEKPAPVQVTWLAYPGTTGLSAIDYRLTDPYLDPPDQGNGPYAETTIRLRDSFWCYDPLTEEPAVSPLPALTNGHVTFGCLNNFCKVNDATLRLWARVLAHVERSHLVLLAPSGSVRARVLDVLRGEGVAAERVEFVDRRARAHYLEVFHRIDLALDTLPYNGHTTSLDSYWMGVPVVTLVGHTVVGRAGLSQLSNLGLSSLVAYTPDEFIAIAVAWARDLPRLSRLRAQLRARLEASPLMNAPRFAESVAAAYRSMWERWSTMNS